MLHCDGLTVSYGSGVAVDGISLGIESAELVALLGPNGAGKSSTLRALSNVTPWTGSVVFDGMDTSRLRPDELARRGLIHVPEGRRIFPNATVHENILIGTAARSNRPQLYSIDEVYDLFPALGNMRGREGWSLSGGEQQMLAIARALVGAPRLLLLDEPCLGLAPRVVQEVFGVLAQLKKTLPMLLVEQNTQVALEHADRAYVLAHGTIAVGGTAAEVSNQQTLIDAYLGRRNRADV